MEQICSRLNMIHGVEVDHVIIFVLNVRHIRPTRLGNDNNKGGGLYSIIYI